MATKVIIENARLSYPALFQPREGQNGGGAKYQATLLIPKTDTKTLTTIQTAIQQEMTAASQPTGAWKGMTPPQPKISFYDGDQVQPQSGKPWGDECKGCMILRTSSTNAPGVVDEFGQKAMDATKFYAGCYCHFSVAFAAYDTAGQKGIGSFLNNVMFAHDGEPLDGHASAQDDFANLIAANSAGAPATPGFSVPGAPATPVAQPPMYNAPAQQPMYTAPAAPAPVAQPGTVVPAPQPGFGGGYAAPAQPATGFAFGGGFGQ